MAGFNLKDLRDMIPEYDGDQNTYSILSNRLILQLRMFPKINKMQSFLLLKVNLSVKQESLFHRDNFKNGTTSKIYLLVITVIVVTRKGYFAI
jgi:hypothetical protein